MKIWEELGLSEDIKKAIAEDRSGSITMEILQRAQDSADGLPKAELFAVAAWYIWWQRRQLVKGESITSPERTATTIKVLCTNFFRASKTNIPDRKREQMWRKPPRGWVNINVDASFSTETMSGTVGAIARDDRGEFVAAAAWFIPHVITAESTEIQAIRNRAWLAQHIGCNSLILESDNLNAVQAFDQQEIYNGNDAAVVMDGKQICTDFASVSYLHCFREANEVADLLAKHSSLSRSSHLWEDFTPDFISQAIVNDLSII